MRRLNVSDDRWLCLESPTSPLQIGGLLHFAADDVEASRFFDVLLTHLATRLPATPLMVVRHDAPFGFDTGAWCDVAHFDLAQHVRRVETDRPLSGGVVHALVASQVMQPVDADRPPFRVLVLDSLADGGVAMMLQTHHSLADGVGFQAIVADLTDASVGGRAETAPRRVDERPPSAPVWLARSSVRFAREAFEHRRGRDDRRRAQDERVAMKGDPEMRRWKTHNVPTLSGPTSAERAYDTLSLPMAAFKAIGGALDATLNDVFLAVVGGALRGYLHELDSLEALGDAPLVALEARSVRRPEDGAYGNHITLMLPQLGTHLADPRQRVAAARASMRAELRRSDVQERLTPAHDRPFGARRRRRTPETGTSAGNVSVANVPGPAEARYLAGYRMTTNYPAPNLPAGHFLNVTMRRYCGALDVGLIADPAKVADLPLIRSLLVAALDELTRAADVI